MKPAPKQEIAVAISTKVETSPVVPAVFIAQPKTKEDAAKMSATDLVNAFGSKSNAIRGLKALDMKTGEIAKSVGVIYQHARNVLLRPLKGVIKAEREAAKAKAVTAADQVSVGATKVSTTATK